jgi:hypothetical protein
MRKDEYIELVQELATGGDVTDDQKAKFHPSVVEKYIDAAFQSLVGEYISVSEVDRDFNWLDELCRWYSVDLSIDCDILVGTLPIDLVPLQNYRAVRYFGGDKGMNTPFNPVSAGIATSLFNSMDVSFVDKDPYFTIKGRAVTVANWQGEKAYLFGLPKFSSLEDYDEVIFPKGNEVAMWTVVSQKILQKGQVPSEKYNDSRTDR